VYETSVIEGFDSADVRHSVLRAHRRVMDAIRARDGDAAERRMARHVGAYIADVRKATPPGRTPRSKRQ
jgi:DNA-binding GntR family transcriptional regulator